MVLKEQNGFGEIVEGVNSVVAAFNNDRVIKLVIRGSYREPRITSIIEQSDTKGISVDYVTNEEWEYSERYKVVALCNKMNFVSEAEFSNIKGTNIVVCLNLKDPQNIGAIARSALAFDFSTLAIPKKRSSPISSAVFSSSAGAIEDLNILTYNSIFSLVKKMRSNDYWIFGVEKGIENSININDMPNANIAILLGNEKSGLSKELLRKLDGICSIETSNNIDSLNVSVAAGIVMEKIYNKTRLK